MVEPFYDKNFKLNKLTNYRFIDNSPHIQHTFVRSAIQKIYQFWMKNRTQNTSSSTLPKEFLSVYLQMEMRSRISRGRSIGLMLIKDSLFIVPNFKCIAHFFASNIDYSVMNTLQRIVYTLNSKLLQYMYVSKFVNMICFCHQWFSDQSKVSLKYFHDFRQRLFLKTLHIPLCSR